MHKYNIYKLAGSRQATAFWVTSRGSQYKHVCVCAGIAACKCVCAKGEGNVGWSGNSGRVGT